MATTVNTKMRVIVNATIATLETDTNVFLATLAANKENVILNIANYSAGPDATPLHCVAITYVYKA